MIILVIGDPHFKVSNVKETELMCEKIISLAEEKEPDLIVNLGDTLDQHAHIHVSPLRRATDFMLRLSKIAKTVLLIGNHDRPNNSNFLSPDHPFSAMKDWPNFLLVEKVERLEISGVNLMFCPYVPPGSFQKALETCPGPVPDMIFAHQEFLGAKMGAIISKEGDAWPVENPYVISGHIHDFDQLQSNILYIGTPIQHGWADRPDKVIGLVELTQFQLGNEDSTTDIEITPLKLGIAKKVTIKVSADKVASLNLEKYKDDEVRIIITGKGPDFLALMKKDVKKCLGVSKVVFEEIHEAPEKRELIKGERFVDRLKKKLEKIIGSAEMIENIFK